MIDKKGTDKVIAIIMIAAVLLMLVFMYGFSGQYTSSVSYAYEDSLFNKDEIIEINIDIDEDEWNDLLENATSEEYYEADVTVNGETYGSCGIRAKGNTSLSMVASSDSDRYSFKINFDEYVKGQTCDGLNKLVLNNNYADATMMKEAIIYDMFNYLGADAPLYNYAKISVNGEYWGVYLALEAVEEEFLIRNYGTEYGKLYKPDSMEMGGGKGNMKDFDMDSFKEKMGWDDEETESDSEMDSFSSIMKKVASMSDDELEEAVENANEAGLDVTKEEVKDMVQIMSPGNASGGDFNPMTAGGNMPGMGGNQDMGNPPDMSDMGSMPDMPDMGNMPDMGSASAGDFDFSKMGGGNDNKSGHGGPGGFGSGSTELNYIDDELDSYSTIWESDVLGDTTDQDHERVVEALKNICTTDADLDTLNKYMDVDNMLRYMAVHTFAVNLDSLTGNMAHNYYLYEEDGQINMIPWDYNLSFGGFQSGNAESMINFPIDTPFSSSISEEDRQLFYALLNNDECLEKYHEYLRILCEDYVGGGVFKETYDRIRTQIDELVETDPTAFYSYDEYEPACEMLEKVINLRAESIIGQLDGSIPSTWDGQNSDSSGLIDCTDIDVSVMGSQMGGGGGFGGNSHEHGKREDTDSSDEKEASNGNAEAAENEQDMSQNTDTSQQDSGMPQGEQNAQGGFDPSKMGGDAPEGFDPSGMGGDAPEGFDPSGMGGDAPEGFDPSQMGGNQPEMGYGNGAAGGRTIGDTIYVEGIGYKTGTGIYKALSNETIEVGSTITQKLYTSSQKKISSKKITFYSGNKKIATVNSYGKITAKKPGTVTIYAKYKGKKYIAKITVVSKGSLNETSTSSDTAGDSDASDSDSGSDGDGSSKAVSSSDASEKTASDSDADASNSSTSGTENKAKSNTSTTYTSKDVSKMSVSELAPYFGLSSDIKLIEDPETTDDYDNNILYNFLIGNYDLDFEFDSYNEAVSYARNLSTRISYLSTSYPELMGSYCNGELKIKFNGSEVNSGRYRDYSSTLPANSFSYNSISNNILSSGKISSQYTIVIPGMSSYQNMFNWMNSMMEQMRRGVEDMEAWMNQYEEESTGPVTLTISISDAVLTDAELYNQQLEALQKALDISAELHNSGKITSSMSDTDIAEFYYDYLDTLGIEGSGLTSRSNAGEYMKHDTIYGCLILKQADCVGHTALYNLFMHIEGVDSVSVCGMFKQSNEGHVLNRLELDGKEYFVDWLNRLPLQDCKSLSRIFTFDTTSLAYARNL